MLRDVCNQNTLTGNGFRRIAFVGYRSGNHWDLERASGFRAGLARHAISPDQAEVLLVDDAGALGRSLRCSVPAGLTFARTPS